MKTVGEVIRRLPVWVNPDHTTESAVILMRGHEIGGLPVLDGRQLVGMVLYSHLLGVDAHRRVGDVMMADIPTIRPEMSVREAAEVMARSSLGRLPVMHEDRLIGVLTSSDLLPELGRSYDPLTELPWADSLREWAIERFQQGREITVLFLDLDEFGQFNKQYGHIVGDEVLQEVARTIVAATKAETDYVCRYGGDEFCIATLRHADDASDLASLICTRIKEINLPTLGGERISCAIGQFGGKRTREREHIHYAATLNNLINYASRDCTEHKRSKPFMLPSAEAIVSVPAAERTPRLQLDRVDVKRRGKTVTAHVDLLLASRQADPGEEQTAVRSNGSTRFSASISEEAEEGNTLLLVARTTAAALHSLLSEEDEVHVVDCIQNQAVDGQTLLTVVCHFTTPEGTRIFAGSAVIGADRYRAAASALLACINRQLSRYLVNPRS